MSGYPNTYTLVQTSQLIDIGKYSVTAAAWYFYLIATIILTMHVNSFHSFAYVCPPHCTIALCSSLAYPPRRAVTLVIRSCGHRSSVTGHRSPVTTYSRCLVLVQRPHIRETPTHCTITRVQTTRRHERAFLATYSTTIDCYRVIGSGHRIVIGYLGLWYVLIWDTKPSD